MAAYVPHRLIGLAAILVLLGCTDDITREEAVTYAQTTKSEMIGISRDETFTCMGSPKIAGSIWTYYFGTCVVRLSMTHGRVGDVDYSTRPPEKTETPLGTPRPQVPDTMEEQCAQIPEVGSCVRWLRNPG